MTKETLSQIYPPALSRWYLLLSFLTWSVISHVNMSFWPVRSDVYRSIVITWCHALCTLTKAVFSPRKNLQLSRKHQSPSHSPGWDSKFESWILAGKWRNCSRTWWWMTIWTKKIELCMASPHLSRQVSFDSISSKFPGNFLEISCCSYMIVQNRNWTTYDIGKIVRH